MSILFLITKSDIGGAQKYVADLASALPKSEFQTRVAYGGVDIRFLTNAFRPYVLFLNDIAAVIEIVLYLRKYRPDIFHLNSSKAGVVGAIGAKLHNVLCSMLDARCLKVRVIFTAHGWVFNPENRYGFMRQRLYILFHKFAALFQDVIINVSEYDRQLALRCHIAPERKLVTIHNGIDHQKLNFFDRASARDQLSKTIFSKSPSLQATNYKLQTTKWIGSIGRLVAEKNYATLIEAAKKLQTTNYKLQTILIGEGYERSLFEQKIAALGLQNAFFLPGNIPDAACYLKAFDIFVMPSIKEGLPYTLLEAMAAGLPIVATKTGGMPEILEPKNAPINGLLVPPRDAGALAGAIQKLLADPELQKTLAANALDYAKRELTLERMVQKTVAAYERLNSPQNK